MDASYSNFEHPKEHDVYSRFVAIPISILPLIEEKILNAREALLLGLIDGFCNHSRGLQCFATNKYLAKKIGCSEGQLGTILTRLYRLKLLSSRTVYLEDRYMRKWPRRYMEIHTDEWNIEDARKLAKKKHKLPPS